MKNQELLRMIPRVDDIIGLVQADASVKNIPYSELISCVREFLDSLRTDILSGKTDKIPAITDIVKKIVKIAVKRCAYSLRPVINATGVVLHTNLGRAVLAAEAAENIKQVAMEYSTLEFSLETGGRGSRHTHTEALICKLTGAEAAMAVNNNAASVMLILMAMCKGKEVIVSRGELVEIGGSFRVPEIMSMSGAILREVGTTNKTNLSDYRSAINENTAALLKVHTSNFKIVGFSQSVSNEELAELGKEMKVPVIYDMGSGIMTSGANINIADELSVKECVASGVDVVCFSGDKLLGGSQAGIIAGKKKYIDMMKKNQLARAVRIDKLNIAALEATLKIYLDPERALKSIPTLASLSATKEELRARAKKLNAMLPSRPDDFTAAVKTSEAQVGGGSAPGELLESSVVQITPLLIGAAELEKSLRDYDIPIIARINKGKVLLDPRTVPDSRFKDIAKAFEAIFPAK